MPKNMILEAPIEGQLLTRQSHQCLDSNKINPINDADLQEFAYTVSTLSDNFTKTEIKNAENYELLKELYEYAIKKINFIQETENDRKTNQANPKTRK